MLSTGAPERLVSRAHLTVACHILKAEFGPVVAKVCTFLLDNGPEALGPIVEGVELPALQVHNSLLVLIQQNIVRCAVRPHVGPKPPTGRGPRAIAHYTPILNEILIRPWFPRMLLTVRSRFGEHEEALLQELLVCGRLPMHKLLDRVAASYAAQQGLKVDAPEIHDARLSLYTAAASLKAAGLICGSETLPLPLQDAPLPPRPPAVSSYDPAANVAAAAATAAANAILNESGGGGSRKRKATAATAAAEVKPAPAKKGRGAAAASSPSSSSSSAAATLPAAAAVGAAGLSPLLSPLLALVDGEAAGSAGMADALTGTGSLWRANAAKFVHEFRHEALSALVTDKLGPLHGGLILAGLQLQHRGHPGGGGGEESRQPFTAEELASKANSAQLALTAGCEKPTLTPAAVRALLDSMRFDPLCEIICTLAGKYYVDTAALSHAVKQSLLEVVVRQKLGDGAARLLRLMLRLHAHGGVTPRGQQKYELKMLSEKAMLPERDTRPLLWELMTHEFIELQEVPRSVDRNPKTTTYLWHVVPDRAFRKLELDVARAAVKMYRRVEAESESLLRAGGYAASANAIHFARDALEMQRTDAVASLHARLDALDTATARLFESLLLMRSL